ncbi:MAG: hypothetical protein ABIB79_04220 [archaeon]
MEFPKCPKCNIELGDIGGDDYADMTEGQQTDYDAGFNHLLECPECGYSTVYEHQIPMNEPDDDELEEIYETIEYLRTSPEGLDWLIKAAYEKESYIEAVSLIHNAIELILQSKLIEHFKSDITKSSIIRNLRWLKDCNQTCLLAGLISERDFKDIEDFNKKRNIAVHDLLKLKTFEEMQKEYDKLKIVAQQGREIQLRLEPPLSEEKKLKMKELEEKRDKLQRI